MKYKLSDFNHLPAMKLKQINYDLDSWKRIVAFMTEENIHLKKRLAELLKDGFNEELLEEIEDYQSSFVTEDDNINQLKKYISEMDELLNREIFEDGSIRNEIDAHVKKLRNEMKKAEYEFSLLKQRFSHYVAENM
jgi:predicted nuclease with TOPRIM domain